MIEGRDDYPGVFGPRADTGSSRGNRGCGSGRCERGRHFTPQT